MKVTHTTISRSLIRGILFAAVLCLLFSGSAGAANLGTYFVYQDVSAFNLEEGEWTSGDNSIQITNGGIYPQGTFVAGTYERGGNKISVISPDVKYEAGAKINNADYLVQTGGIVYSGSDLSVSVISPVSDIPIEQIILYKPDGTTEYFASAKADMKISGIGNYRIEVIFPTNAFVEGMIPVNAASKFTFKCIDINPSISASADTLYRGEVVRITVEGTPGMEYLLNVNGFEIPESQLYGPEVTSTANQYALTIPSMGKVTFSAKVNTNQNLASLELVGVKNGELEFLIRPTVITAQSSASSYFLGDDVIISGTSTSGKPLTFSLASTNIEIDLTEYITSQEFGKTWKVTISTENLVNTDGEELGVGAYTLMIKEDEVVVATVVIPLKQPIITLTSLPEAAVQGTALTITGRAEAAKSAQYYIFGQYLFKSGVVPTSNAVFEINVYIDESYAPGQYFLVVQHPMYDGKFNIYPDGGDIMMKFTSSDSGIPLFNVYDRQTANAAQALCDALKSQNIDDTYVKGAFFVVKDENSGGSSEPENIYKSVIITPSDSLEVGQSVTGSLKIRIPGNTMAVSDYIAFTSPLENLKLNTDISRSGVIIVNDFTSSKISGFMLESQLDLILDITFSGVVSEESKGKSISVIGITCSPSEIGKYTSPEQAVAPLVTDSEIVHLNPGWNFISVPKYLDSTCDTAGELLGSLDTDGISPLGYDAKTGWYVLKADTAVKPLDGYWVYSKGADEITLKYSTAVNTPPAKTVYKGWNAVGLSAEKPMTAKSAFSNLDWVRCMPWDTEQSKWGTVIVNGGSSENSAELKLGLGNGHWLYVEADGTYLGNTA